MDLRSIIARATAGEPLSEAERKELASFDFNGGESPELPALREQLQAAEQERDTARHELEELRFGYRVTELAGRCGFTDPEYLKYLFSRKGISPDQSEAAETYLAELKEQSPKLFRLDLRPGAGPLPAPAPGNGSAAGTHPADELARRLESAPEITV